MPWNKRNEPPRERLDEATSAVPVLRDAHQKIRLTLVHIAGLSTLVTNLTTEVAQHRYALDRVRDDLAAVKTDVGRLVDELHTFRQEVGEV